jgi:hypothetical protein
MPAHQDIAIARLNISKSTKAPGLKSSEERGLCNGCVQFNWEYHLARYINNRDRDPIFMLESSHVDQVVTNYSQTPRSQFLDPGDGWCLITGAPYGGTYQIREDRSATKIELEPCLFEELTQRNCSLCGIILSSLRTAGSASQSSYYKTSAQLRRRSSSVMRIKQIVITCSDPTGDASYDPPVLEITIDLQFNGIRNRFTFGFAFQDFRTGKAIHSMLSRHHIDLGQVKQWLKTCESEPQDRCRPGTIHNISNFKVVDVQTNRVVSAPENCTYIALSYVWGSAQPFRVKKDDFHSLQCSTRSSIASYAQLDRQKLPRTIRDAMFVVEAIGERYLWVDSLCILDDDEVEIKEMIHAMDTIYKSASFTIIAASGEDADFGLPGLYPGSRSIQYSIGSIDGVRLVSTEKNMRLDLSPWAKRGWTYQEYQFSTKTLVFIDDRVFLEYAGFVFGEANPNRPVLVSGKTRLSDDTSSSNYYSHVQNYTGRELTYDGDILNAFTAILQDHSVRFGTVFCWGLPLQHFTESLMWTNGRHYDKTSTPLTRRAGSQKGRAAFPSWSWAGWTGHVQYDHCDNATSFSRKLISDITWPWNSDYRISSMLFDVFKTGILAIEVQFGTLDLSRCSYLDSLYCQFDGTVERTGEIQQCFLLARIKAEADTWNNECIPRNHILIAVKLASSGIYYRSGLFRVQETRWMAAKPERKWILLG